MGAQLRTVGPGDLGWIISMHGSIYAQEFNFNSEFEVGIAKKALAISESKDPFNQIWIREIDGERAASIAVSKASDGAAFINFVLVMDKFRGSGIAMELMQHLIAYVREQRIDTIRLETFNCLINARKMYKKLGFKLSNIPHESEHYGLILEQEFWELQLLS